MTADPLPGAAAARGLRSGRLGRAGAAAVVSLLLLGAAALLVASLLSYATVKHRLDAFASDHRADFSQSRFDTAVWQARAAAGVLAAAAAAALARRRRLAAVVDALARSVRLECGAALAGARASLAAESRLHLGALGLVSVGALLVRLDFLTQPMRYDEADTYVHYASRPLYVGVTAYTAPNNHVLHTVLVHVSTALFGDRPWAIRLPALVAGLLLVPAAYLCGRLLYDRESALLAAALVATSSTLVEYSTNARGYTLVALVALLLLALATRLVRGGGPASWTAFAVLAALGLWTIPVALYAVAAVTVWLVWESLAEGRGTAALLGPLAAALAGAALLSAVLYVPVLVAAGPHALLGNSFVEPRSLGYVAHHLPGSLRSTFARWHRDQPAPLWALLVLGFAISCLPHRRPGRFRVPPAAAALVAIPPLLLLQRVVPFERVWLFLLPVYFLGAAAGLVFVARGRLASPRGRAVVAAVAVALCAGLAGEAAASRAVARSEDTSTFRDAPAVAAYLERVVRPGDRVLAAPPADQILEYYLDADGLDGGTLLYGGPQGRRLYAVVKEGPREYPLPVVLRRHLSPAAARAVRATLLRRFPHALVYRLRGARG